MPIISKVEARTVRGKLIQAVITLVLIVGGISMLYPFVVMLSGSVRSEIDAADLDIVPSYLVNDTVLYTKFLETKYNQNITWLNRAHLFNNYGFRGMQAPQGDPQVIARKAADFEAYQTQEPLPRHWQVLGGVEARKTVPENLRKLRKNLYKKYDGNLEAFSQEMGTASSSWLTLVMNVPKWESRRFDEQDNPLYRAYYELLEQSDLAERQLVSLTGSFMQSMIYPVYGQTDIAAYNEAHSVPIRNFESFRLPQTVPGEDQAKLRSEWIEFVQQEINVSFVALRDVPVSKYRDFLRQSYSSIGELNKIWQTQYTDFDQVALPDGRWIKGSERQDYAEFLKTLKPENYVLTGPEFSYRRWLEKSYGSIAALNEAYGSHHESFSQVPMPVAEQEYQYVLNNSGSLRWSYAARNYINVFDELAGEGRVLFNTLFFCFLAITLALLVNPLAAYAMSRFQLPGTYKILLLLMATMAFPPMVTLIPQFIILRNLDLLNTFAALVIPLVANGYMVFLLKGFFDSLPTELYEAARIDGASELRMFFQITLALSQPVLAVLALMVFNGAYTTFLYGLLVAPNEDMWLISVWLYQFQTRSNMGGVFAAVVVASLPTLLIFLFAQRVIMRGIVVPTEK